MAGVKESQSGQSIYTKSLLMETSIRKTVRINDVLSTFSGIMRRMIYVEIFFRR
jgi:hypothetical protein